MVLLERLRLYNCVHIYAVWCTHYVDFCIALQWMHMSAMVSKSPPTRPFVKQLFQANYRDNYEAPHYRSLARGFPAQRVNDAETVIKSWYHHEHGLLWFDTSLLHQLPQYSDVIMGAMASQINGVSSICLTVCSGAYKKYIQAPRLWPFFFLGGGVLEGGNQPVTAGFPSQSANNVENVSIWWRHHDTIISLSQSASEASVENTGKQIPWVYRNDFIRK